jgi:hypothetical protein
VTLYCVLCRAELPPDRIKPKVKTCSDDCAREIKRLFRQERAKKECRLCGRKFRRVANLGAVPQAHAEATA